MVGSINNPAVFGLLLFYPRYEKKWRGGLIKLFERSVAGSNQCPQYFTNSIFVVGHNNFNFAVSPVDQSAQGGAVGVQQTAQNTR